MFIIHYIKLKLIYTYSKYVDVLDQHSFCKLRKYAFNGI